MPRLASCLVCGAIEKLIDPPADVRLVPATVEWDDGGVIREHTFQGEDGLVAMVPEYDPLMEDVVARHTHGQDDVTAMSAIKVFNCDWDTYESLDAVDFVKKALAQQTDQLMEESDHYKDGALRCYNQHGNPDAKTGCSDYMSDEKVIGSKQIPPKNRVYLCHMCPYTQTYVMAEIRKKADLYTDPMKYEKVKRARKARMDARDRVLRARSRKNRQ
jgi:hypothetical protein